MLSPICLLSDGCDVRGVGIFHADVEEAQKIMDENPGVQAGIFVSQMHACRSFPGDSLPLEEDMAELSTVVLCAGLPSNLLPVIS